MSESRSGFLRFVGGTLKAIDVIRRVILNVVVFGIIAIVLIAIFAPEGPTVPGRAALALKPEGVLVEQVPDPVSRALKKLIGRPVQPVTPVRDLVRGLDAAARDPHIKAVTLNLNNFAGGTLAQLRRVAEAIRRFQKSGKPVIAYGNYFTQGSYYLAAYADRAYLTNSQGVVALLGLAAYRNYYKELIDKLRVQWHVFRVGKYKSFVEPFTRNSMSPAAQKETTALLSTLWKHYVDDIAAARGKEPAAIIALVNDIPEELSNTHGNAAALAVNNGLVDGVMPMPVLEKTVAGIVAGDANADHYDSVSLNHYLAARDPAARIANRAWDQVAIIVAAGPIVPGKAPPGTIGADTLSKLMLRAAHSDRIEAVVLDVNSPGGSALASDAILHAELELKRSGKPLVVSMAGVAASGGYWISMAGDRILASPVTITGSIGIFGMFPTFQKTAAWIGIHRDGVKTAPLANLLDPLQPMSESAAKVFKLLIRHGYHEFVGNVAQYRGLPLSHVKTIAQGRVWSGEAAKRIGLIDDFGDLSDAVKAAANMAGLEQYGVRYIEPRFSQMQQLILQLAAEPNARGVSRQLFGLAGGHPLVTAASPLLEGLKSALKLRDPRAIYAYCFCGAAAVIH